MDRHVLSLILIFIGTVVGHYCYAWFQEPNFDKAWDRSYYLAIAFLVAIVTIYLIECEPPHGHPWP